MGLFSKKKKDNNLVTTSLNFYDGLDLFFKGEKLDVIYNKEDKKLIIKSKFKLKDTGEYKEHTININEITKAAFMSEQDIIEKKKSVGGRAIAGGVLLGPLGAIVGGISGTGTKTKKGEMKNYFILNTIDKVITFDIPITNFNYNNIIKEINNNI